MTNSFRKQYHYLKIRRFAKIRLLGHNSKICSGEDTQECIEVLHAEFRDAPTNSKKTHQKVFSKKARFLGQSQNTFWYFLLTQLLENELEMIHVDF